MSSSQAHVSTPNAERYLRQLCSHWGHKFAVDVEPGHGRIEFGEGRNCELWASHGHLDVEVRATEDALPRLQDVVAEHLNRFAHREGELAFDWHPAG